MEFDPIEKQRLEEQLRAAAPPLPPELRDRVMQHCRERQNAQRKHSRRAEWRFAWTLACLCAAHWIAMSLLETQRASLMAGSPARQETRSLLVMGTTNGSSVDVEKALRLRSRMLATLLEDHDAGYQKGENNVFNQAGS